MVIVHHTKAMHVVITKNKCVDICVLSRKLLESCSCPVLMQTHTEQNHLENSLLMTGLCALGSGLMLLPRICQGLLKRCSRLRRRASLVSSISKHSQIFLEQGQYWKAKVESCAVYHRYHRPVEPFVLLQKHS